MLGPSLTLSYCPATGSPVSMVMAVWLFLFFTTCLAVWLAAALLAVWLSGCLSYSQCVTSTPRTRIQPRPACYSLSQNPFTKPTAVLLTELHRLAGGNSSCPPQSGRSSDSRPLDTNYKRTQQRICHTEIDKDVFKALSMSNDIRRLSIIIY